LNHHFASAALGGSIEVPTLSGKLATTPKNITKNITKTTTTTEWAATTKTAACIAIDRATRVLYFEVYDNKTAANAVEFLPLE
jgi:hypothetical protein